MSGYQQTLQGALGTVPPDYEPESVAERMDDPPPKVVDRPDPTENLRAREDREGGGDD